MKLRHSVLSAALIQVAFITSYTPTLIGQSNKQDAKFNAAFTEGTKALDEQRWNDGLKSFDKASQYNSSRTDAAFYWKAYTLTKLNHAQEAAATCEILHTRFADSSWNKDCASLMINANLNVQVNTLLAKSLVSPHPMPMPNPALDMQFNFDARGGDPESDIKFLALNSLMRQNPTQAMPVLRGILSGDGSIQMKRHALFILTRDKSPEAKALLEDVARGKMGPELQREGIRTLASSQGAKSNDTLLDIYKTSTDVKVKESVISAIATTQDAPRLVDMARNEKDLKLKRDIVSYLASMHDKVAQDYMLELLK